MTTAHEDSHNLHEDIMYAIKYVDYGPPYLGESDFCNKDSVKANGGRWNASHKKWEARDKKSLRNLIQSNVWTPCGVSPGVGWYMIEHIDKGGRTPVANTNAMERFLFHRRDCADSKFDATKDSEVLSNGNVCTYALLCHACGVLVDSRLQFGLECDCLLGCSWRSCKVCRVPLFGKDICSTCYQFTRLSYEFGDVIHGRVIFKVVQALLSEDPCNNIRGVCEVSLQFNDLCNGDYFWKVACELAGYDRKDRTTGFHEMQSKDVNMTWKDQFVKWCGLRFKDDNALRAAVQQLLAMDAEGNANHRLYGPIGSWDVSRVTDMSFMFNEASSFNGNVANWTFPRVTSMLAMFEQATSFNGDVSNWTFPMVTDMSGMFEGATSFNGNVSNWTFPMVTDMSHMFSGAASFDGDVSNWKFPMVTNMSHMFNEASSFNGNVSNWTFPRVTSMLAMFEQATSFNGDVSNWTFPRVTYMSYMFEGATSFNGNVSNWTFRMVTDMSHMFEGATSFNRDVSNWTFPMVTDMSHMFSGATSFTMSYTSTWGINQSYLQAEIID